MSNEVCIIGGGSAGLLTLRHLKGRARVDLFEALDDIGGQWYFSPLTEVNCPPGNHFLERFGYLPNSTHKELVTNLPSIGMSFMDFPLIPEKRSFIKMEEFHRYIKQYTHHHELWPFIHLNHIVLKVRFNQAHKKFKVQVLNCKSSEVFTRWYDYVVVANGKFSKPYIPQIPGQFQGEIVHSHSIRSFTPSLCKDKRVVLVGLSDSGLDIFEYLLSQYGSLRSLIIVCDPKWTHSSEYINSLTERGAFQHKLKIARFEGGKRVSFSDGDTREADIILLCTGYHFSFPFLEEGLLTMYGKKKHTKGFGPLYLRSIHVENPQLLFIGFIGDIRLQYIIEWNAILASYIILGKVKWDSHTLKQLHEAEIEEAKKHDPDLTSFNICTSHYHFFTHLKRLKEACGVRADFNKAEEEVMQKYSDRLMSLRRKNPFSVKQTNFKDLTLGGEVLRPRAPSSSPSPKL